MANMDRLSIKFCSFLGGGGVVGGGGVFCFVGGGCSLIGCFLLLWLGWGMVVVVVLSF